MADRMKAQDAVRKNAQNYFTQSEQRDKLLRQEIEKERAASAAKTAKLRALRLAKEAADKAEADKLAAEKAKLTEAKRVQRSKRANKG
jgi:hypothetical protein